jgi:hypothetical protein
MIVVKETGDGKWGLYLDGLLLGDSKLGDSKHRYEADHAKQILLRYLEKHGGDTQTDTGPT